MLGYRKVGKDDDGHDVFEINEEEAEIVRRIFREFIAGYSITLICKNLTAAGYKTKLGKTNWCHSTIESILTNEKYTGDAILGKTFKPDVLTKARQKNDGKKAPMYFVEDTHPAIIDKEMFELAKKEMAHRRGSKDNSVGNSRFTSKYPFSGLLQCGYCGAKLRRQVRTVGSGKKIPSWGCSNRILNGRSKCDSHHINEDVLEATYLAVLNELIDNASEIAGMISEGADLAMSTENSAALEQIDNEIIALQEAALDLHKAKQQMKIGAADYAAKVKEYSEKMRALEEQREELQTTELQYAAVKVWLDTFMEQTVKEGAITEVDRTTLKMLVERILVRDDGMEVIFKCGVSIEKEYVR